jgi:hypothetical protein
LVEIAENPSDAYLAQTYIHHFMTDFFLPAMVFSLMYLQFLIYAHVEKIWCLLQQEIHICGVQCYKDIQNQFENIMKLHKLPKNFIEHCNIKYVLSCSFTHEHVCRMSVGLICKRVCHHTHTHTYIHS